MSLTDQQNQEMARLGLKVLKFLYNLLLELIKKMNERQARENFDKLVKLHPEKIDVVTIDPTHKDEFIIRASKEKLNCYKMELDDEFNQINILFSKDDTSKMGVVLNKLGKEPIKEVISKEDFEKIKNDTEAINLLKEEISKYPFLKDLNIEDIDIDDLIKNIEENIENEAEVLNLSEEEINRNETFENKKNNSFRDIITNLKDEDSSRIFDRSIKIPKEYWNDFKVIANKNNIKYNLLENIDNKHKIEFSNKNRENILDFLKEKEIGRLDNSIKDLKSQIFGDSKGFKKTLNEILNIIKPKVLLEKKKHEQNKLRNKDFGTKER